MKNLYILIAVALLSLCVITVLPSYSMCVGTYELHIQKDNGTDADGYHTYQIPIGDNKTYQIKYKISSNATLEGISWQKENPALNLVIREASQGGNLTIQLPMKLLGPYSGGYTVEKGTMCAMIAGATFPTPIEFNSNFTTVSFPLMDYDGGRELIIINGNSESITSIQPAGGPPIVISTPKFLFVGGEIIPISGYSQGNSPVNIFLLDNYGNIENSTRVMSDNTGSFSSEIGIPQHVIGGGWYLFAKSDKYSAMSEIMVNTSGVSTMTLHISNLPPLKQFKLGIDPYSIVCRQDLQLMIKLKDNSPACVKSASIERLLKQGWVNAYDRNGN